MKFSARDLNQMVIPELKLSQIEETTKKNAEIIPKIEISKNKAKSGRKSLGKTKSKLN